MASMMRFYRHGDGAVSLFNDSLEIENLFVKLKQNNSSILIAQSNFDIANLLPALPISSHNSGEFNSFFVRHNSSNGLFRLLLIPFSF